MPAVVAPLIYSLIVYGGITAVAWELAALALVSILLTPKQGRNQHGSQLGNGQTHEYAGTVEPRRIIYGRNLVAGMNAIPPWCHGSSNEYLDQVLVIAGHRVTSMGDMYFNQELCDNAHIQGVIGAAGDGLIGQTSFANKIWARRYGGFQNTVDYILNTAWPTYWTSTHVGYNCAYIALQYLFDSTVFSGGKPEVKIMVDGKKVYDPRLDSAPGLNPTNAAYIVYSTNPALCIIDYIMDANLGVGEAAARIDWVSAVAAANVCDENVTIPGSTTQKRYTCNVVLDVTDAYEDNLRTLSGAMQGAVVYSSGKWVLLPGKYLAPTFALNDNDLEGEFQARTAIPYSDRYNAVRGQFYDPANFYQPSEYSPARALADESADGETVWRELQQGTCTTTYEAQRNAMILQRMSRRKKSWTIAANVGTYGIRPGDFGTLTIAELGINVAAVKCLGWRFDGKGMGIQLSLVEVDSNDWNDPATVTYAAPGTILTAAPGNFIPAPTTNLQANGVAAGVDLTWTLPGIWYNNLTVDVYSSFTSNLADALKVWSGVNTGVFIAEPDNSTRYFWTRVRNVSGGGVSATNGPVSATPLGAIAGPQGPAGDGGLSASLTLNVVALQADSAGHVSVYPPISGRFRVFKGLEDVSGDCIFQLAPNGDPDNVLYSLAPDGTYTITGGMPDDVDQTTLTLAAVYIPPA